MVSLVKLLKEVLITEGGNIFRTPEYETKSIPLDNILPTTTRFVEDLSRIFPGKASTFKELLNKDNWLGSTGRNLGMLI